MYPSFSFNFMMRYFIIKAVMLLTGISVTAVSAEDWSISRSKFQGPQQALIWSARVGDPDGKDKPFHAVICYGSAGLKNLRTPAGARRLYSFALSFSDDKRGTLSLWRRELVSTVAIASPPRRIQYTFRLDMGGRFRLSREHVLAIRGDDVAADAKEEVLLKNLREEPRRLALALRDKDASLIESAPIVRLAIRMLTSEKPLSNPVRNIYIKSAQASINDKRADVPFKVNDFGRTVLRLPARLKDKLVLRPVLMLREYTAYSQTVLVQQKPLPAFAFVKLGRGDGSIRAYGKAGGNPGEFELGPINIIALKKLELNVVYPLEPPGRRPRLSADLLFRTGRSIETYLDKGILPPAPRPGAGFAMRDVIPLVIKTAARAINPDLGKLEGLNDRELVDLYAIGYKRIPRYPELKALLNGALIEEFARRSWTYPSKELSDQDGWTHGDARKVLEYGGLADSLALKLRREVEPREWTTPNKKSKSAIRVRKADTESAAPHALAAAALSRANAKKYDKLILAQLKHIMRTHRGESPTRWKLEDLLQAGQALKYVAANTKGPTAQLAGTLTRRVKFEAYRRFKRSHAKLSLRQKVRIAHVISPVWRPYLNTPKKLTAATLPPDLEPIDVGPGGQNSLDKKLQEARLRYRAALLRAVHELKPAKIAVVKKRSRLRLLAERWREHLGRAYPGPHPPAFKDLLDKDLMTALRNLNEARDS